MRGIHIGILYKLLGRINTNGCVTIVFPEPDDLSSCLVDLAMLWHQQMGHNGEKRLCVMHNKGMVEDLHDCSEEVDFYEHCINGK